MPVKRRVDKRRAKLDPEAWAMAFESGFDFFGDLEPIGLVFMPGSDDRAAAKIAWDAALRDAWAQHGADFLQHRDPHQYGTPWALETFGPPEEMEEARCR